MEVNEFGVCLDTEALGGYLCLITGECNYDCIDICFSKGTTCMQRLRCPWGDSASVSMVSATSQILMPDRHGMILAEIR